MNRLRTAGLGSLLFTAASVLAGESRADSSEVTPEKVRAALDTLMKQPLTKRGEEAAKMIGWYSAGWVTRKDVKMVVRAEETPWLNRKKLPEHAQLLVCAHMAGSILSQLDTGVYRHDPYSGQIQVFRLYRVLQKQVKGYKVPEIEELLKLHREGKLMKHLIDLEAKKERTKPSARGKP